VALLAKETFSDTGPEAVGLKVKVKGALWPAGIVIGNVIPLREYGAETDGADVIVTLAPLAIKDPLLLRLLPTVTLPKLKDDGETLNCACGGGAFVLPVPERATVRLAFEALEEIVRFPLELVALAGENVAPSVTLWPPDTLTGKLAPLTLKALLDELI
jgi:hypothetical protein